ncbi:MAG: hypothetical protein RLZZ303_2312 [Candidatus Hydrogenedentota bacterium]|jgi:hypothetical protein
MLRLSVLSCILIAAALAGCMSGGQVPPAEAFHSLGRVDLPAPESPEGEGMDSAVDAALAAEEQLAGWQEKYRENSRQLRGLAWSIRARYRMPGAYTIHLLYRAASDVNGDVQVTEVTRRLEMARGIERTTEALPPGDEDYDRAVTAAALARAYTLPQPGTMERLLQPENIVDAQTSGRVTVRGEGFVMPGDSVELTLAPLGFQPESMRFTAPLGENPVEGKVTYRKLPDGMFYPYTVSLGFPDGAASVLVENFGFRLQPR